jgi:SAM-dependent methyltransferase
MKRPIAPATIARRFLPSRWHHHYVRSKLATDPLFEGVAGALDGNAAPLLDLGCGLGLLAHALHACGHRGDYLGVDNDRRKIERARAAAAGCEFTHARFETIDLAEAVAAGDCVAPFDHRGSVAILDLLQFLPPAAQAPLLRRAADCIDQHGLLVIRTGLAGPGWRTRVTRWVDGLSRLLGWMNTGPKDYPTRAALETLLSQAGLEPRFTPLWGGTPFNNWLVVAGRGSPSSGSTQR